MLTIAGTKYTMSEICHTIKQDPHMVWKKFYPHYLLKINRSGAANFGTFTDLLMRLASYVMGEPKEGGTKLARYRGDGPIGQSAMTLDPVAATAVHQDDVAAVQALMATGQAGVGTSNNGAHTTDPETGLPKIGGVTVTEFYVNGDEGRRVTKRTELGKITYYYSRSHVANTYMYARLI